MVGFDGLVLGLAVRVVVGFAVVVETSIDDGGSDVIEGLESGGIEDFLAIPLLRAANTPTTRMEMPRTMLVATAQIGVGAVVEVEELTEPLFGEKIQIKRGMRAATRPTKVPTAHCVVGSLIQRILPVQLDRIQVDKRAIHADTYKLRRRFLSIRSPGKNGQQHVKRSGGCPRALKPRARQIEQRPRGAQAACRCSTTTIGHSEVGGRERAAADVAAADRTERRRP